MQTGDGLLVRLRPNNGLLSLGQLFGVAEAANEFGNGLIEITARGSLQIRGLRQETATLFAEAVENSAILASSGPGIEISPLHGLDPTELGDAKTLATELRSRLGPLLSHDAIAPKLAMTVDAGGRFSIGSLSADIKIKAISHQRWAVWLAGNERSSCGIGDFTSAEVVPVVGQILKSLIDQGVHVRARELNLSKLFPGSPRTMQAAPQFVSFQSYTGLHDLGPGNWALGLRPRFGQMQSDTLKTFLDRAAEAGASDLRLAPDRHLMLTGLSKAGAKAISTEARNFGFSVSLDDPEHLVSTCPGVGNCASAFYDTKGLADAILRSSPELLDGSLHLHLSGCSKGCAHPAPAFALVGVPEGMAVLIDGKAQDQPDAMISGEDIRFALERLSRHLGKQRRAGESTAACLTRLGGKRAVAALLQG